MSTHTRKGEFHEDEDVVLTGNVERCHFYRCDVLVKGPAKIVDCVFSCPQIDIQIEIVEGSVSFERCRFDSEARWQT